MACRMLTLARAAQSRDPIGYAEALSVRGLAMTGADTAAVEAALGAAQDLASRAGHGGGRGGHYGEPLLQVQTALCYQALGATQQAVDVFEVTLVPGAFSRRDHGYFTALMASALVATAEPDAAAVHGEAALEIALDTGSGRTLREVERLARDLRPWAHRPVVQHLIEAIPA